MSIRTFHQEVRRGIASCARVLAIALVAVSPFACTEPIGPDELSDFMLRSPGDYYFSTMIQFKPSATSTDSILFQWQEARGAERYTIVFKQAQSADSADAWIADLSTPTFTIPVATPQKVLITVGVPNPLLDTIPLPQVPALQYVLKMRDLDALVANQPKGVTLYYVWSIEAHKGSKTGRSTEFHRFSLIRN